MKNKIAVCILFLLSFSMFFSCDQRPSHVLKRKDMENLLVEIHLLEGSLRASGYYYGTSGKRERYYNGLFNKFNISHADYDSSLVWYTQHPKQFERICKNVTTRLDSLNSDVERGKFITDINKILETESLWNKKPRYIFTSDSPRNKMYFEVKNPVFLPQDFYTLSFYHRLSPADSSHNHHAVMYINYKNGPTDSIYTKTHNDSVLRKYTLKLKARYNKEVESISGYLLANDSVAGKMGAVLDSIQLSRSYNPYKQDSIYDAVHQTTDTLKGADKEIQKRELQPMKPSMR